MPASRRHFRGYVQRADVPPRMTVACLDCGALPGNRCFVLSSWVVPRIPLQGFFTERMEGFHPGRRVPKAQHEPDPRTELRKRISSLVMTKLAGTERMWVRRWAGSTRRVEQELAEKITELEAMPDLTW